MCNDEGVTDKALLTSVCFFISFDLVSNPGSTCFFFGPHLNFGGKTSPNSANKSCTALSAVLFLSGCHQYKCIMMSLNVICGLGPYPIKNSC